MTTELNECHQCEKEVINDDSIILCTPCFNNELSKRSLPPVTHVHCKHCGLFGLFENIIKHLPHCLRRKEMTSEVVNEVLNAAQEVAPNAPVVEAAVAAVSTVADPSPANLLADVELAYKLIQQFKADIAGLHPTVGNILKALF